MTCAVSKLPGLTRTPTAQWLNFTMGDKIIGMPTPNKSALNFLSLKTSDAGTYRCHGNLNTTVRSLSDSSYYNLTVQSESNFHSYRMSALSKFRRLYVLEDRGLNDHMKCCGFRRLNFKELQLRCLTSICENHNIFSASKIKRYMVITCT